MITWTSSVDEIIGAPEDELIRHSLACDPMPGEKGTLRRITKDIVVKITVNGSVHDLQRQELAWQLLKGSCLRVPRAYRFLETDDYGDWDRAYLFMEYLPGMSLSESTRHDDPQVLERVVKGIQTLHTKSAEALEKDPTLFTSIGSYAEGFPWAEQPPTAASSIEDLERIVNGRLESGSRNAPPPISFQGHAVGLCHLDLAPRNIYLLDDGDVALVDWATAAFLPLIFELASLSHMSHYVTPEDQRFMNSLMQRVEQWIPFDEVLAFQIQRFHGNSIQYAYDDGAYASLSLDMWINAASINVNTVPVVAPGLWV